MFNKNYMVDYFAKPKFGIYLRKGFAAQTIILAK